MSARAEQLRSARLLFERALAAGLTLEETRRRDAAARWREADRRLADRRHQESPEGERQLEWWQR